MTGKPIRLTPAIFALAASLEGQEPKKSLDLNRHAWFSYSGDHPVSSRWGIHFDGQWRRSDLGLAWQQYQIRPGVNFTASKGLMLTLGYVYTRAFPYGEFPVGAAFPEHRIYQQALIESPAGGAKIQQRIRAEQRWIRYPNGQPLRWTYQNRLRYMLRVEAPLVRGGGAVQWYLPVYNEILVGLPPNYGSRPWDQNRLFAGLGRATRFANIEVGFLNQFLGQRNGSVFEMNNTLLVTVTSNVSVGRIWQR